jgi:hypothetical protein
LKCERSTGCSMGPISPEMPPNVGAKIVSTGAAKLGGDVASPAVPAALAPSPPTEAPGAEPVGGATAAPAAAVTQGAVGQEVMVRSSGPPVLTDPVGVPGGEIPVAPSQLPQ